MFRYYVLSHLAQHSIAACRLRANGLLAMPCSEVRLDIPEFIK